MSVTVQTWHWLVDEKLIGSKECHNLRPSLTRHLTSTSCKNKQKQACATRNDLVDLVAEEWSQQKSYTFKISQHGVSRTDTNKHHTCNKNKSQSQHTSPHISTHLHTSPHISTHLNTSPHISTHLHTLEMAASPFGMSANLRPSLGESSPGNLKYSGVMYPIAANMEILKHHWKVAAEVPKEK